jgi:guanidinopropionase
MIDRHLMPMDPSVSPRFGDVATLLRAPRVGPDAGIDIGLVGVPFDLGTNYRTGARGGPAAVREASRTIRLVHPSSRIAPFELCQVADLGDVAINAMDIGASLSAIQAYFQSLRGLESPRSRSAATTQYRCRFCAPSQKINR